MNGEINLFLNIRLSKSWHEFFQETHVWAKSYWCACEALHETAVWRGKKSVFHILPLILMFKCVKSYFINWTCAFLFVSVFICIFRSSTLSMCSSYSASPCGWLIIIIFTPYAYSSSPLGLSSSHYMRFARWAYSWILDLMIMYLFRPQNG